MTYGPYPLPSTKHLVNITIKNITNPLVNEGLCKSAISIPMTIIFLNMFFTIKNKYLESYTFVPNLNVQL